MASITFLDHGQIGVQKTVIKQAEERCVWYFVDEAGDPTFYDRHGKVILGIEGCSPILILGFIETEYPEEIREALNGVKEKVEQDPYLRGIPSLSKSLRAFHAKDDIPEIRQEVFKVLTELPFKCQFIVARKKLNTFLNTFNGRESAFYDHLVTHLFRNVLHRAADNRIYFATRGSRSRQLPFQEAIEKGVGEFERKWQASVSSTVTLLPQSPVGEPCLQAIDYAVWALYRAYTKREMRFFNVLRERVSLVVDLYDTNKYPNNYYDKRNPFDIKKISPL